MLNKILKILNGLVVLWRWFDGKKTVIGTIFLFIATIINEVVIAIIGLNFPWLVITAKVFSYFGLMFGGVGVTHKGVKKK